MTTTTSTTTARLSLRHPTVAAAAGAVAYGLSFAAGEVFHLNSDQAGSPPTTAQEIGIYVLLAAAAMATASWFGLRGWRGDPGTLAKTALGLALGAAVTVLVFWSGWPLVLGAAAAGLALEHRRRIGSFSGLSIAAAAIGSLAVITGAFTCVFG
jgi:hypothetical protein